MIEKLERELKEAIIMPVEQIAKWLDQECERDPALVQNILDEKKSLSKCYKYIEKKAEDINKNSERVLCVDDPTVFGWAKEYYMSEEKEPEKQAAKGEKAEEEAEEKPKKKSRSKKKATEDENKKDLPEETTKTETPIEVPAAEEKGTETQVVPGGASWLD